MHAGVAILAKGAALQIVTSFAPRIEPRIEERQGAPAVKCAFVHLPHPVVCCPPEGRCTHVQCSARKGGDPASSVLPAREVNLLALRHAVRAAVLKLRRCRWIRENPIKRRWSLLGLCVPAAGKSFRRAGAGGEKGPR